ncbi:MAG: hypothetical protein FJ306_00195 [Planctomycetes bacterium]|nr:hypothetical protein [Planctomycetota bacterium]
MSCRSPIRRLCLPAAWFAAAFAACGGGGGGGGGAGGATPVVPREWGPLAATYRGPGAQSAFSYRPVVEVENRGLARNATVLASVPFVWGQTQDLATWSVQGHATHWRVLQRWADNSVRVAQAQWTMDVPAVSTVTLDVVDGVGSAVGGTFAPNPAFAAGLPYFGVQAQDPFGVVYEASFFGATETLHETALVRTRRQRRYPYSAAPNGLGRNYLTATWYVTEFRDQPVALVDLLVGNDYLGKDDPAGSPDPNLYPLGGVDVDSVRFFVEGADLALPYRAAEEAIGPAVVAGPRSTFELMRETYISDGQTRRYRFVLLRDEPGASTAQRAADRADAQAMVSEPLFPLASHASWRATHALGTLGGPGPAPADAAQRAAADWASWSANAANFGTWGAHGDFPRTEATGTPRNGPLSQVLGRAVQSRDSRLLWMLEQMAWTQAMRPCHLYGLRVGNDDPLLLWNGVPLYPGATDYAPESLGRRRFRVADPYGAYRTRVPGGYGHAHGFSAFDVEHWSTDLLFDYWTVTGDAWAKEELRQLGESLRGLLRPNGYYTSNLLPARAEGWCLFGFVQAWLATGDLRFRDAALDRLHGIVDRDRDKASPMRAIAVDTDANRPGWPGPLEHAMPWQHGALLYGLLAAWKHFGDPFALQLATAIPQVVRNAWVSGVTSPTFGFVADGLRYYVPIAVGGVDVAADHFDAQFGVSFGDAPLRGAHSFLLGGLLMLAETATAAADRDLARTYGELLLQAPLDDDDRWDKWFFGVPATWLP